MRTNKIAKSTCRRVSKFRNGFTDLRLLQDNPALACTPHREKVKVSLKNAGNGVVFYTSSRVDFASETRLDERNFPDGDGLEKVVRHPGLRVEEPDPRSVARVLKRRQHLRGKRKHREKRVAWETKKTPEKKR